MEDDGKFDKNEKQLLQREYVNKKEWLDWFSKKIENENEIQTETQTCTYCYKRCPVLQFNSGYFPFILPDYEKRPVSIYVELGKSGKITSITRCEANTGNAPTAEDHRLEDEEMRRTFFFGGDMETPIEKLNTTLNFNEEGNATTLTDTRPTSQGMAINLIEAYMDRVARDGQAKNQAMYQQMFRDLMTPLDAEVGFVVYHMYRYFSKFYHFEASVF